MNRINHLVGILSVAVIGMAGAQASADLITEWNFNGESAGTVPGGSGSPTASFGAGTASLFGGTTATFASGVANGGSSDPIITNPPNLAWNTTTYGASTEPSGSRGVEFHVSTAGYLSDIIVEWDQRLSNTASRYFQFMYSLDGINFTSAGVADEGIFEASLGGDTWYNNRSVDLSLIAGVADNANFAFRIVAVHSPAGGFIAATPGSAYAGSGTSRFDMVQVFGVIPTPGAVVLLGLGALVGGRRRRA